MDMVFAEYAVQGEAQAIAVSEGHYGGCTTDEHALAAQYINNFCQGQNQGASLASAADNIYPNVPTAYGTNITVTLEVPYSFKVFGGSVPGITLTGVGKSVSGYIQGMTPDASYTELWP